MNIYRSEHEVIVEDDNNIIHIPIQAIAVRAELLGYENLVDALEAIVHVAINGEPDHCPKTLENAWTEAIMSMGKRECDRESEAEKAYAEDTRDDPRSPLLRSALAAQKVEPIVEQCRQSVRSKLGLPDPRRKLSVMRGSKTVCEAETHCQSESGALCSEDREKAAECLSELIPDLEFGRVTFLHSLTDNPTDPLGFILPEETPREVTQADILERYS